MKGTTALPISLPVVLIPGNREQLSELIEALIAALDRMDGDPDLEPSLGWIEYGQGVGRFDSGYDDREEENEYGVA